jgi:hypothetical protein
MDTAVFEEKATLLHTNEETPTFLQKIFCFYCIPSWLVFILAILVALIPLLCFFLINPLGDPCYHVSNITVAMFDFTCSNVDYCGCICKIESLPQFCSTNSIRYPIGCFADCFKCKDNPLNHNNKTSQFIKKENFNTILDKFESTSCNYSHSRNLVTPTYFENNKTMLYLNIEQCSEDTFISIQIPILFYKYASTISLNCTYQYTNEHHKSPTLNLVLLISLFIGLTMSIYLSFTVIIRSKISTCC